MVKRMTGATGMPQRLRLHLGAHRTATTAFQAAMHEAAPQLADAGIGFLAPWRPGSREDAGLRRAARLVTRAAGQRGLMQLLKRREARAAMQALIAAESAGVLIVSDENLLGDPFSYPDGRAIYPDCARQLAMTAAALQTAPERVHLTIRDYASFLVSVYAMQALYRPGAPEFAAIRRRLLAVDQGWLGVLRAVRASFPRAEITFARYEDRPVETAILALAAPELALETVPVPARRANPAPSAAAIAAALQTGGRRPGDADALIARYQGGAPFDPLDAGTSAALSARYQAELVQIGTEFREIRAPGQGG